jgi:CRISPR/Cas system-associated exonuclease Cas4 (RecB family)
VNVTIRAPAEADPDAAPVADPVPLEGLVLGFAFAVPPAAGDGLAVAVAVTVGTGPGSAFALLFAGWQAAIERTATTPPVASAVILIALRIAASG